MKSIWTLAVVFLGVAFLTACGGKSGSPDEFSVLPTKPLEQPESYTILPPPDPQARNLASRRPLADSVLALGGNDALLDSKKITSSERALIAAASKDGVLDDIRDILSSEPTKRSNDRLLYRLLGRKDPKGQGFADALDPNAELERLKSLGVKTPAAPASRQ